MSSRDGMDDKPFSSSLVITLCARPMAVVGSSHTLIPTLVLSMARVSGGVVAVTSKDGVGEGAVWTEGRVEVSAFSSLTFLFFKFEVKLAKGYFSSF